MSLQTFLIFTVYMHIKKNICADVKKTFGSVVVRLTAAGWSTFRSPQQADGSRQSAAADCCGCRSVQSLMRHNCFKMEVSVTRDGGGRSGRSGEGGAEAVLDVSPRLDSQWDAISARVLGKPSISLMF